MIANLWYIIIWILLALRRTVKVFIRFLSRDALKLIHFAMIVLSNAMIVLWINIIIIENVTFNQDGYVQSTKDYNKVFWQIYPLLNDPNSKYSTIDIFSELARLHRIYSILAAICCSLTFWRILHFFQFSLRLSALTEVLVLASTDIYHFLLMFALLLCSFALIATAYFGENFI